MHLARTYPRVHVRTQLPTLAHQTRAKGFKKVSLAAGAEAVVTIPLTPRDLSIWDVASHSWQVTCQSQGQGTYVLVCTRMWYVCVY
jgi:hypothetical protein